MNNLISVIIPSYNVASFVCDAVRSALEQTFSPIEVLVIDDSSTDNTREALEQYRDRIRYHCLEHAGIVRARNTGIRLASGTLLAFLDADDVWLPNKLSKQYDCLVQQPEIGVVHANILHWNMVTGEKISKEAGRDRFTGDCYTQLLSENRVSASSVLVRRECFDKAGWFDERFERDGDWEMWSRIARHYRFAYVPEPLVIYRSHNANLTDNTVKVNESKLIPFIKALKSDPQLIEHFGMSFTNNKLTWLNNDICYNLLDIVDIGRARYCFGQMLVLYQRQAFRIFPYFAYCLLPDKIAKYLQRMKQRYLP